MMIANKGWVACVLAMMIVGVARGAGEGAVSKERMEEIYREVRTPFKYGMVIRPGEGKKVDCPCVFRFGGKWYMVYVELEPAPEEGYTTRLAESEDLLHWTLVGTILDRGKEGEWDHANAGGGVALFDTRWGGSNELQKFEGRYWMTYLGGKDFGYEKIPLSIGVAWSEDPTKGWVKEGRPVMTTGDADVRAGERGTLYKSYVFRDEGRTLGAKFVMFYNAKDATSSENIFCAVSEDMRRWKRVGDGPVVANGAKRGVISGDPQVVRMGGEWVMFYFGAFWRPGAFDTFAASKDLMHWTKWEGEALVRSSEEWDRTFAHKPWVIKYEGVVYHFYCAVGGKGERGIGVATSREMRGKD